MIKKWKIGAIVGAICGISILIIPFINVMYVSFFTQHFISPTPSLESAIVFYFFLFLPILSGALIGATVGFVIDKYREGDKDYDEE